MPAEYRTLSEIGRGGFCVVHECLDDSGRRVAVKRLLPDAKLNPEVVARFQREARLMDDVLDHENIVSVIDRRVTGDDPYFVMERADENLIVGLAGGKGSDESWVISIFRQMLRGMAYAHERSVIHRDLKPENALIFGGTVKIADFGLGKHLVDDGTRGLTRTAQWSGTEPYMAPEQFTAMKDTGPEADVFSLGKILAAMLVGGPPQVGQPDLVAMPERFRYFVSRCCAQKPENRYVDAREALAAFERILSPETTQSVTDRLAALVETWFGAASDDELGVVRQIDECLRAHADEERMFTGKLPKLPNDLVDRYMDEMPDEFLATLTAYDGHVSGGLPFETCDEVTDFYVRLFGRTMDPRLKELVIHRLVDMGAMHNRFYVRTQLLELLESHKDATTVEIGVDVLARARAQHRRFLNERVSNYDLAEPLRVAIAESGRL